MCFFSFRRPDIATPSPQLAAWCLQTLFPRETRKLNTLVYAVCGGRGRTSYVWEALCRTLLQWAGWLAYSLAIKGDRIMKSSFKLSRFSPRTQEGRPQQRVERWIGISSFVHYYLSLHLKLYMLYVNADFQTFPRDVS